MFCSECGKQVADDAKFCGECGAVQTTAGFETTTTASNNMHSCPSCKVKGWEHGKQCRKCGYVEGEEVTNTNKLQASVTSPSSGNSNVAGYVVGAIMLVGLGYFTVSHFAADKAETTEIVQSNQVESLSTQSTKKDVPQQHEMSTSSSTQVEKYYVNDSGGALSDADFESALEVVKALSPKLLDDSQKVTSSPLCSGVHSTFANKMFLLFEIQTHFISNAVKVGIDNGESSCAKKDFPADNGVEFGLREELANTAYITIINTCFVDGKSEFIKMMNVITPVFTRISNCEHADKYQTKAHQFIMLPKFDNYR